MVTAFIITYWELIVIGFLLLNTGIQKLEKIKGNSDILTWLWQFLTWIKSIAGQLISVVFSAKAGKLPMLFIGFFLTSLLLVAPALTDTPTTFQWDANVEVDLAGYRVYMSSQSAVYVYGETSPNLISQLLKGPNPGGLEEVTVEIPDGTWYFVATAFDTEGKESGPSIELTDVFNGPPGCVKVFRFK